MPTAIDTAIAEAADEILGDVKEIDKKIASAAGVEGDTDEGESPEESEVSTDTEEETSDDDDFDEATLSEAKNLYRAIKGEQGPAIIAALAQQAGLLKAETKTEVRENVRSLQQIVEEALGPEFKMLAPQMTKMMTAVLETERQERSARFNEIEQANVTREVTSVMDKVAKESKISVSQLEKLISPLTGEFLPGPKTSVETYIRGLYKQATVGRTASQDRAKLADKARRNASDAPSRLNSAGSISESKLPSKKMSLKESIAWAQQEIASKKG